MPKPIALIILDGFGYSKTEKHNAIAQANTPNLDSYFKNYTHSFISGSGHDVGLPKGQMGNSEVGHLNIGAGRLVPQDLTRVDLAIEDGSFFENKTLVNAVESCISQDKALHVFGLLSDGGVHSHVDQVIAMLKLAHDRGLRKIYLHAFLDGRDTPPQSALASIEKVQQQGFAKIATLVGRYYAMDRDNRWDRVQLAYDCLTGVNCEFECDNASDALQAAYDRGEMDEFVKPTYISDTAFVEDGDAIVFMNFRADRAREITKAFTDTEKEFDGFKRAKMPSLSHFVTLTEYQKGLNVEVAYPLLNLHNTFGEYVSSLGLNQLRIAETEKYAHVTFFFNGGVEQPFENEDRILIPSPQVATYDLQPEMSAPELTDQLVAAIKGNKYDAIVCNYANPDMVGHTGNMEAAVKAIEAVDTCLGRVIDALQKVGGEAIITADHGNAEKMYNDDTAQPHTAHTSELVPMLYIGRKANLVKEDGVLADLAPTLLYLMGLDKPVEMTGESLVEVL